MCIADYDSLEIPTFVNGFVAGKQGRPFDEHADEIWKDGYGWGQLERTCPENRALRVVRAPGWDPAIKHHRSI